MSRKRPAKTLAEVAMVRVGFRGGVRAMTFIALWGTAAERLGRHPTTEEYGDVWLKSRATAYREKQAYERCFPDVPIEQMWEHCRGQLRSRGPTAALEVGALVLG